ncbi:hypothetical protein H6A18_11375, partial [Collinsella tanakaei]|uniref:hypothetical protein n=1 Tax=Collinsella tanakaei TaxID=626935 RepID=UPI001957541F
FSIRNRRTGQSFGTYEGSTDLDALCAMHNDAGYVVALDETGTELVFESEDDREVCGDADAWIVSEVIDHTGDTTM